MNFFNKTFYLKIAPPQNVGQLYVPAVGSYIEIMYVKYKNA